MRLHVPPEQLWTEFQGDLKFEYDHEAYWPALVKMCEEKHAELKARWIRAGKNYGENETYLKGGDGPSIASFTEAAGNPNDTPVDGKGGAVDQTAALKPEDEA